jgi:hypothetical protein
MGFTRRMRHENQKSMKKSMKHAICGLGTSFQNDPLKKAEFKLEEGI